MHTRRSAPLEVLGLRRAQHERMPSLATYTGLRAAAEAVDAWELERDGGYDIAAWIDDAPLLPAPRERRVELGLGAALLGLAGLLALAQSRAL